MDEEQTTDSVSDEVPTPPAVVEEPIPESNLEVPPVVVEESIVVPAPNPVVPDPIIAEPVTEQIIEPVIKPEKPVEVEPAPEPVIAKPEPTPAPPLPIPTLVKTPKPEPQQSLPRSSSPELTTGDPSPITATFDVASLSDEQLRAAAILYTKRNQAEISRKGVAKRKETMELNLREIVDFLSHNNGSPLPRIAKNTNITPGTTSKYLRQLIANDKVRAEGWGKTRRFYLK